MTTVMLIVALLVGLVAINLFFVVEQRISDLEKRYDRDHGAEDDPIDPRFMQ